MNKYKNLKKVATFTIILAFGLIGYLASYAGFDSKYAAVSTFFIVILALPSFYFYLQSNTKYRLLLLICLMLFALLFEGQALFTGWPYSEFSYSDKIAGKLFNIIPWTIAFAWPPLLLASATITQKYSKNWPTYTLLIAFYLVTIDLVLDPAASAAGLWIWNNPSGFYGVPFQNFFGWFVSGLLGAIIFIGFSKLCNHKILDPKILFSTTLSLAFWTGSLLYFEFILPLILALVLISHQIYYVIRSKN